MGKQQWVSFFEKVRDTIIAKAIQRSRYEKVPPETTLAMLGYMVFLNLTNEELEQQLDRLEKKDEKLAKYLKSKNYDLDELRSTIGIKFSQ